MSDEFVAIEKEGECIYSGVKTHFKYRGEYIDSVFLISGRKLWNEFKEKEPDLTLDKSIEIVIGALMERAMHGEEAFEVSKLKEGRKWSSKIKKLFLK